MITEQQFRVRQQIDLIDFQLPRMRDVLAVDNGLHMKPLERDRHRELRRQIRVAVKHRAYLEQRLAISRPDES